VEKVFPDWVETAPNGYKRVTVRGLEALVVEALRRIRSEEQLLESRLAAQEKELAALKELRSERLSKAQ
jgi:hypothetical protein